MLDQSCIDQHVDRLVILGSGGGGRTAASILEAAMSHQPALQRPLGFLDDADQRPEINGYPVWGPVNRAFDGSLWKDRPAFIIAFGSLHLSARRRIFHELHSSQRQLFNAIHPRAEIDRTARLGLGNIIAANCVIHPNAEVGSNCFLCVAVTIDHDDRIGNNVYFSPGVHLAGAVEIDNDVFIGSGAVVLPSVRIGRGAIIGAGAVVKHDVAPGQTVVGVPARPISQKEKPDDPRY
jgi:acetyltransferase EpsM